MKASTKRYLGTAVASALAIAATTVVLAHGGPGKRSDPGWDGQHGMMRGPGAMHSQTGNPGHMMGAFGDMRTRGSRAGSMMGRDPMVKADKYLLELRKELEITSEQETTWNAYEDAVRGAATMMSSHQANMRGSDPMTTEQRLELHEQGLERMQSVVAASRSLYGSLTPEQQSRAGDLSHFHHGRW